MRLREFVSGAAILILAVGMAAPAFAQQQQTPSVAVTPAHATTDDPNEGQWFHTTLAPGQTRRLEARVTNPGDSDQTVKMYLADVVFDREGLAQLRTDSREVGTWGSVDQEDLVVPARESVITVFSITAPEGIEPGDHVGALVAESAPEGDGQISIVKRVATRIYATIPGDARRDIAVESVEVTRDSFWYPREATVTVALRNTGRIRLQPTVEVNDVAAKGPDIILSQSVESFIANRPVPFWGGFVRYRIDVTTRSGDFEGPARQMRVSTFVFPWHMLALLLLVGGSVYGGRWAWRKRGNKYTALQDDIRRIERLLAGQAAQGNGGVIEFDDDPEGAILAAMKQARRAGDKDTEARLKEKLEASHVLRDAAASAPADGEEPEVSIGSPDDAVPDPLVAILQSLATAPAKQRGKLVEAARAFGPQAIKKHADLLEALPDEVRVQLSGKKRTTKPKSSTRSTRPKS